MLCNLLLAQKTNSQFHTRIRYLLLLITFILSSLGFGQTNEKLVLKNLNPKDYENQLSNNEIELEMGSRIAFKTKTGTLGIIEVLDINIDKYLYLRIMINGEIQFRQITYGSKNYNWQNVRRDRRSLSELLKVTNGNLDLDSHLGRNYENLKSQPGQDFYIKNFPESQSLTSSGINQRYLEQLGSLRNDSVQQFRIDPRTGEVVRRIENVSEKKFILESRNQCLFFNINHYRSKRLFGVYVPIRNMNPLLPNYSGEDEKIFYLNGLGFYETRDRQNLKFVDDIDPNSIGKAGVVFKYQNVVYYLTDTDYSNSSLGQYSTDQDCDSKYLTLPEGVFSVDISDITVPVAIRGSYIKEIKLEQENYYCKLIFRSGDNVYVGKAFFGLNQKTSVFTLSEVPWRKKTLGNKFNDITLRIKTQNSLIIKNNRAAPWVGIGSSFNFTRRGKLCGWVEMHAHPMSYLGFGQKVFYGVPDIGLTLPKTYNNCDHEQKLTENIFDALGNCRILHQKFPDIDPFFNCKDQIRSIVNASADEKFDHTDDSFYIGANQNSRLNYFKHWPAQRSLTHQQMYSSWLKKAYTGGLRVMVALTVNNVLLAELAKGNPPYDDKSVSDAQTLEMIRMAELPANRTWMEIARSPDDLRRIVEEDKLAVILGVEIDQIGNWGTKNQPTENEITTEIQRLYDQGIRYIFPVHLVDNVFGGAAVYSHLFNVANVFYNGAPFELRHNEYLTNDFSDFDAKNSIKDIKNLALGVAPPIAVGLSGAANIIPLIPPGLIDATFNVGGAITSILAISEAHRIGIMNNISEGLTTNYSDIEPGHSNNKGLSNEGKFAIKEMMKRGMMIDIDHMSEQALEELREYIRNDLDNISYPFNSGHNTVRVSRSSSERFIRRDLMSDLVANTGGILGLGSGDTTPELFVEGYFENMKTFKTSGSIAIGTDVNGFGELPQKSPEYNYSPRWNENHSIPLSVSGDRIWDYTKEGVAHYGLMYEFLYDIGSRDFYQGSSSLNRGKIVYDNMFKSTNHFYNMWLKCINLSSTID